MYIAHLLSFFDHFICFPLILFGTFTDLTCVRLYDVICLVDVFFSPDSLLFSFGFESHLVVSLLCVFSFFLS